MHEARDSDNLRKGVGISQYAKTFSVSHRVEGLSTLVNSPLEMFAKIKINTVTARRIWLQFSASAPCLGYQPPTFAYRHERTTLIFPDTNSKIPQNQLQGCSYMVYGEVDVIQLWLKASEELMLVMWEGQFFSSLGKLSIFFVYPCKMPFRIEWSWIWNWGLHCAVLPNCEQSRAFY